MRYLIARIFQGILTLFGVSLLTFFLPSLYTSPISLAISVLGTRHVTHAELLAWVSAHGFDQPLVVQYWHWLWGALHGYFGISYASSHASQLVSVNTVLSGTLWRSVWLVTIPTVASILIAIPIGLTQAVRRNKLYDHTMTTLVYVLYSTPTILICVLIIYYLGVVLGFGTTRIAPLAIQVAPHNFPFWMLHHLNQFYLPFLALVALSVGGLTRFMRGSALDTLVQDHVRTARAKGASPTRVLFRHVLRPSLIPLITILGLTFPAIIGGALIVENAFGYPGMGVLAVQSITNNDTYVVMAITIFTAFLTVAGNFLADVFVAVVDPRVRLGAAR